ncbi:MAG: polyprenyl synthetase family protein [Dehalococcoidia bacterium]|nr:polyprenyl synthetase family protein [Dehalococcoidia bacterium]
MAELPVALGRHLGQIEAALKTNLGQGTSPLDAVGRYVMGWEDEQGRPRTTGGKRLRPALCLFAAELFGASPEDALPGAVAVELIHNFSLVHDEVQDRDAERHHRPTVWALHGEGQAINAGDHLITRAIAALIEKPRHAERSLAALRLLNDAMARMIAGQWSDISFESRDDVTPSEYIEMIRGKTGALLGAPLAMGALFAGATAAQAERLQRWGETVGLAFQVRDDYLGIWGNPDLTGKSNISDLLRKKKTLPVVFGIEHDGSGTIRKVYAQETVTAEDVPQVVAALERVDTPEFVEGEAAKLVFEAARLLDDFELPAPAREALREIGAYLVERDN